MNIIFIGYRGTGKSVLAGLLTDRLKRKLFSIDRMIVEAEGMPVPQIVGEKGWPHFREIESKMVEKACRDIQNGVIDCGGGVILNDQNILHLKENGKIVLLTADIKTILKRIRNDANRPPLKEGGLSFEEEQKQILVEREPKYLAAADFICDTSLNKPGQTVQEIFDHIKQKGWI